MADIEAPEGYFVGRPLNLNHEKQATAATEDEMVNAQVPGYYAGRVKGGKTAAGDQSSAAQVPGYYAGRVQGRKTATGDQNPSAAVQSNGESGFLARWFGCFSGVGKEK